MFNHADLCRDKLNLFADFFAHPVQFIPAAGAGFVVDIMQHFHAWQLWCNAWSARFRRGFSWFFRCWCIGFNHFFRLCFNHLFGFIEHLAIAFVGFTTWAKPFVLREVQHFFKALHPLGQFLRERL